MRQNPDLLDALAATQLARNMDEVMDAEKTGGPRLSARSLGYLSLIYRKQGLAWEHPEAEIPEEIPEEVLREIGATRLRAAPRPRAGADTTTSAFPIGRGTSVTARPRGALFAGLDISAEQKTPEYLSLQQGLQTRLRTSRNPSKLYADVEADVIQSHATAEKALAFYRELGVPDERLGDLIVENEAARRLALNERLSFALGALQNARDAILAK